MEDYDKVPPYFKLDFIILPTIAFAKASIEAIIVALSQAKAAIKVIMFTAARTPHDSRIKVTAIVEVKSNCY